ncbi:MAG: hypothetical protein HRT70_10990, partial [Flavobacteriaceae bacterium]|nr:hypothetical protein [Flavobacteriaceae bacterium]
SYPKVVAANLDTGQETTVFTYGDAPNDYGNTNAINYLSKSINLVPGSYAILVKWIPPPPDGDYSTYPPQPAVEYHSTNIDLYTFESISDDALSSFVEQFEVGGARVQRIHNEDHNGHFLNATKYNYNYPSAPEEISSSGKLMDDLIFHSKASGFHSYNPRGYGSSPLMLTSHNVVGVNNSAQGSHIGYSFVQEIQEDANGNRKGWIEKDYHNQGNLYFTDSFNLPYQYDASEGDGDPYIKVFGIKTKWFCSGLDLGNDCAGTVRYTSSHGYVSIDNTLLLGLPTRMDFGYVNGNILEQRVFNLDGDILEKTENTYHSLNGEISLDYFSSFMNVGIPFTSDSWQGENGISANVWSSWEEGMWGANHHTYYPYQFPIHHGLVSKLSKTVNYKYFNSDEFITESHNFYDEDTHHVKSTIQIIDENDQISSHLFYPYDAEVFSSPHMSNLRNENRLSTVVKTEQYKNDVKLSTVEYSYDHSNNTSWKTLISKTKQSKGENNLETKINYLQYDNFGNLLEKNIEGEVHTTYLWG